MLIPAARLGNAPYRCEVRTIYAMNTDNNVGPVPRTGRKEGLPQRKQIHLESFDYSDCAAVFFVTLCCYDKQQYFSRQEITQIIIDEIDFRVRCAQEVMVFTYCVMPDHVHLLLKLKKEYGKSLHNWVAVFKRYITRTVGRQFGVLLLWQKNFYEHVVRKEESLEKIAEYIVNNPVRKGLVDDWQKYPYSKIDFRDI